MCRGFLPLISIVTHEKPGCKGSCIDNFITNDIENVLHTGTISDKISHHFPIVQIFQSNLKPIKNTTKCIQYYDYCNSNVDKFVEMLEEDLSSSSSMDDFGTFYQKFNLQSWLPHVNLMCPSALNVQCKITHGSQVV